jgi:hypothetical protein
MLCSVINPFQVTKPVDPSEVIDRDGETRQLVDLALESNNARLVAPRRFGKTSLLKRVQVELANQGWIPVYVDLLGIVSADDFTARVERAYTRQLTGQVARWWAGVRRSLKPSASAGGGPVPASISVDLSGQSREALVERLDLPTKVRSQTGNRVHVVFDEFQELNCLAQRNVDQVLRSVIQHHGDAASYVFAGSQLHMMEMMFAEPQRAFYGQTQKVSLKPLADEALAAYIVSRFEGTGKTLRAEVLDALLGLVLGHPQRAMVAAHALWGATDGEADLSDWEDARVALMDGVDDELRALWMGADVSEREALVLVAAGLSPYSRAGGRTRGGNTVRAVDALTAKGVIAKQDREYVVDPLFGEWIRGQRGRPGG